MTNVFSIGAALQRRLHKSRIETTMPQTTFHENICYFNQKGRLEALLPKAESGAAIEPAFG